MKCKDTFLSNLNRVCSLVLFSFHKNQYATCCEFALSNSDSHGVVWGGAQIEVVVSELSLRLYFTTVFQVVWPNPVCPDKSVELIYIPGLCASLPSRIEQYAKSYSIQHYPSPSNGPIHFSGSTSAGEAVGFSVYDITGKLFFRQNMPAGNIHFDYDTSARGMYYYTFIQRKSTISQGKILAQ